MSKRAKLEAFNEYIKAGTGPLVPGAPGTLTLQTLVGGKQKSLKGAKLQAWAHVGDQHDGSLRVIPLGVTKDDRVEMTEGRVKKYVVRMPPLCTENTKCSGFRPNRFVPELCDVCEGLLYDHKQNPAAPSAKHFVVPPEQKTGETLPPKVEAKYSVSNEADALVKKAEARRGPKKHFWQRRKKKRKTQQQEQIAGAPYGVFRPHTPPNLLYQQEEAAIVAEKAKADAAAAEAAAEAKRLEEKAAAAAAEALLDSGAMAAMERTPDNVVIGAAAGMANLFAGGGEDRAIAAAAAAEAEAAAAGGGAGAQTPASQPVEKGAHPHGNKVKGFESYYGQWFLGRAHGMGVMTLSNGCQYEGQWKFGRRHGQGTMTHPNGDFYRGTFKKDKMCDEGVFVLAETGDVYSGQWSNDRMNGIGTYTWANGDQYEGEWRDGCMSGDGCLVTVEGHSYRGQFLDGKKHGRGVIKLASGDEYAGQFAKDDIKGFGVMTSRTGMIIQTRPDDFLIEHVRKETREAMKDMVKARFFEGTPATPLTPSRKAARDAAPSMAGLGLAEGDVRKVLGAVARAESPRTPEQGR